MADAIARRLSINVCLSPLESTAGPQPIHIDSVRPLAILEVMSKSQSQLNPKVKKLFTGTEVGALLEDVDSKLGTIIEGQQTIERKLDRPSKNHHDLKRRVTAPRFAWTLSR
jgi:hypothetical protein